MKMKKDILKICSKHGELMEGQVHKENNKRLKRGFTYRCNQCKLEKDRRWKDANRIQHNESAGRARNEARRLYREGLTNIEPKANIWAREDRKNDPYKHREYNKRVRIKKGKNRSVEESCRIMHISIADYQQMVKDQNNLCAICFNPEKRMSRTGKETTRLAIDHCHKTNKIRGLLCHSCNTAIGKFNDNIQLMESAIAYLKKHQCS
jgi:Recombination endonuclease VII